MPHIKSIRLVNVHFNNATQFYDDFKMELGGGNTTYDLENGGGKSLLLLMLLQTVLPKSFLRKEKPVSLLFQGGKDRTSHAAVEWILEEGSHYKYLLTGFCARKRKGSSEPADRGASEEEENIQSADIEHLNWCVFYNDNKIAGIREIPLVTEENGKKIYAGFEEIRKYVQQMKQKGLPAEVFDGIDKYQSYISGHHLLTAEWNIIKGINSGETNIESYFRQNATSRKLIENQFIKIIEDVEALNKGNKNNDESLLLADTLIEIRNRLNEYLKLKEHMAEFTRIKEYYLEFGRRNDELYQAFITYEACKQQAAAIRNLIGNKIKSLEQEKSEALNRLEQNTQSSKESQNRKKKLEAGLVNHEKEELLSKKQQLETERDRLTQTQHGLEENLNQLLTLEAYGEYRAVKEKLNETQARIQALETDGDALKAGYRKAGGRLKFLTDRLVEELETLYEKSVETRGELENEKGNNQQALIKEERKAAILEETVNTLLKKETALGEKSKVLNDFFLDCGEAEAVLSPDEFLWKIQADLNNHILESSSITGKIESIDSRVRSLDLEMIKIEGEINTNDESKKQCENWLNTYQQKLEELESKAAGFAKPNLEEYKESLELLIHKEGLNKLEKEIEAGRLRHKKQLSEEKGFYIPNEVILGLTEQLSAKCEFVKAGIEWIHESKPEDKESVMREIPYLPYSVIVDRASFEKLKNGKLKLDFSSDYPVPIVNLETVRLMKNQAKEDVYYFCSFAGLVIDSGLYAQYIQGIEAALKAIDSEILASETRISELNADLLKISSFFEIYSGEQVDDNREKITTLERKKTGLEKSLFDIQGEKKRILQEKDVLHTRTFELTALIDNYKEKVEKLNKSIETGKELAGIRERLSGAHQEFDAVTRNIAGVKDVLTKLELQYQSIDSKIKELMLELHDAKNNQEHLSSFEEEENQLSIIEARAEYKALNEAVSGRLTEESDLRSRLNEYEERLNALKIRVLRDYGGDLVRIEESEVEGVLVIVPSQEVIKIAKQDKEENAQKLKAAAEKVTEINRKITKAEGRLEELLKSISEDKDAELPHYDSDMRYRQEIELAEQLIKNYLDAINNVNDELDKISKESDKLNHQAEDYDAFIEREEVANDGVIAAETKDFRQFENEYHRFSANIRQQCDKWEDRIKTIHEETAAFVIHEPLEELSKISKPINANQCFTRKEAFTEYVANIEEQMEKITNDILKLENYQQDFTRRCIQRAELILGHLRKLESLSRIEVYGRRINMIELKLQEFEEKEKQLRMKAHIGGIVREISEEGMIDRKRVAARLSTKELLAQIADLDKAAVRLYKIESIPENSRFYRWEHAIGSEGQNNSLYFIFAACLISFIRMLSITNTSIRTKKVIIADNPFGATSAVYLWDPMFKIMKQNDIQLIAPGHRIPREITSRFGVSYLLNQDILQDGRMRVVVKDVRVEEDEDLLRYVDVDQIALF